MAKTPEEVRDALDEFVMFGNRGLWDEVLAEIHAGDLVVEQNHEGILIRARPVDVKCDRCD